jgi:uncharacterized Tic20 family protein
MDLYFPGGGSKVNVQNELSKEDKTWGMLCHITGFSGYITILGFILGPLIIWLIKKDRSSFVDDQGKEALNFQISFLIYSVIAGFLCLILIGFILLPIIGILHIVFMIVASVKANDGVSYRYPMTIRFLK